MSAQPATPGRIVTLAVAGAAPSRDELAPLRSLVVSLDETATLLGVSHSTIKALVRDGQLPVIRIGSRVLVERSAIRAFIKSARSIQKEARSASSKHAAGL